MAPKPAPTTSSKGQAKTASSSKKKAASAAPIDGADEEPLSAVILADSFDSRFSPLTLTRPRCLLPVCGVPLINLTLERLLQAGASKVYVLSKSHTHLVRQHIELLRRSGALTGLDIVVYALPSATSVGHAMQDLDSKQVIRGDFILVQPDAVGNVDLREMVRIHTERKKLDRDAIMTIGMMSVEPQARNSPPSSSPIVALRSKSQQLLHWAFHTPAASARHASLPYEDTFLDSVLDASTSEVDLRSDLRETGIDICGIEVPPLFSENFDYQKLRRDFVVGILTSDLLDSKLFVHVANEADKIDSVQSPASTSAYGSRCDSTRAYNGISLDVLSRFTFPIVPGSPSWPGERLEARLASRFQSTDGVEVSRNAIVGSHTLISSWCTLEDGVRLNRSTLCEGVSIQQGSTIEGSHIFKNVQIGPRCKVTSSIIGERVKLLEGVIVEPGCLVADGCTLGPDVTIQAGSRIATRRLADVKRAEEEESDGEDDATTKAAHPLPPPGSDARLGRDSIGYLWPALGVKDSEYEDDSDEEDDEDDDVLEAPATLRHLVIGADLRQSETADTASQDSLSSVDGDSEFDFGSGSDEDSDASDIDGDEDYPTATPGLSTHLDSLTLSGDDAALDEAAASARQADFSSEASASLDRAFDEGHTIDNASIELKTLRMASNVPPSSVRRVVVDKLMERCDASDVKKTGQWLNRWSPLLNNIGSNGPMEGCETILFVQEFCARDQGNKMALFTGVVTKLYNDDLISDEGVLDWAQDKRSEGADVSEEAVRKRMRELKEKAKTIIEHAGESSDEESDEESDDD